MVKQLGLKIQIISCPIIRERNGLAMSSRNERLEPELRQKAGIIFNTLNQNHKVETPEDIKQIIEEVVQKIDSVDELQTQYFVIVDGTDLKPLEAVTDIDPGKKYFGCIAVFAGEIRLIDNVEFSFPVSKG
jgi:pantoate--beta-alanine ligase